jgi:hypothetical protein
MNGVRPVGLFGATGAGGTFLNSLITGRSPSLSEYGINTAFGGVGGVLPFNPFGTAVDAGLAYLTRQFAGGRPVTGAGLERALAVGALFGTPLLAGDTQLERQVLAVPSNLLQGLLGQ